jgi:lipopolysaccharide/colanic/teichoic acid biosynthesis glycosyltransferase
MTTRAVHGFVMRTFDVVASAAALVVLSPVLAVVALVVRVTMGRPVFFTDQRAGRRGQPFRLVKFRTMRAPRADEQGYAHDAVRLTPVGRFLRSTSLDELPTLWNVLRGDMAIVGPRPLPVQYLPRYSAEHNRRHEVRPGITGWAQVNGRNALSWDDRLDLDVWYVDHRSVRLDARIIVRTVTTVVRREGISHAGHATMPEFKGSGAPKPT